VKDGLTVGYVFVTQAVGKSSGLTVMTGISARGVITGVVVTADNETAGYVDRVEKAGFFQQFTGKEVPLLDVNGDIDTVSQATKTSKGIAAAVDTAIERYYIVVKEEQE
jgi:Na+-translocating ferredoxin:NAD+ oxidoreductase RnfG subunit